MADQLRKRSEIPVEETWKIEDIFSTDEEFLKARTKLVDQAKDFQKKFEGRLEDTKSPERIVEAIKQYEDFLLHLYEVSLYASLGSSADLTDSKWQKYSQENGLIISNALAETTFFTSELSYAKAEVLENACKLAPQYSTYLSDLIRGKEHLLSKETEAALAALHSALDLSSEIYETMKATDMQFPDVEVAGKKHPLSYVSYEAHYCEEKDTELRREAFRVFSETLRKYRNTTAAAYNAQVQKEKTISKLRGFDSVFDYLLFDQKVTKDMYDRQIDTIMKELAPHMRKFVKLIQKQYGLKELYYSDLKLPLDPDFAPQVSIEESKAYISEAMKVMGQDYHDQVMKAYEERWIDFAQNVGKSTGGFCAGLRTAHPYILLNWNGALSEVFTLAHELGHGMQDILCAKENSLLEADFTLYDVEAPSTFHEMLLTNSLMKSNQDPRFQRWVLASMISNTYYHNYVTHLLEACYQREVYRLVDAGESLQADTLDAIYKKVLEDFWGDTVILDEGAERTWMRQPHYYMGLYSYVYSASLCIATAMFKKLQEEGENVLDDWKKYLATGGPMAPAEHADILGIDIRTDRPLRDSIEFIGQMVDQIDKLSERL